MIDKIIQPYTQPFLKRISKFLIKFISPNQMTFIGFLFGLIMCLFILLDMYVFAIFALFCNRFCDGLDGVMARILAPTPLGGYLDIVLDFLIYAGFVLTFGLTDYSNLPFACFLLFLYIGTSSTFLAHAAILQNHNHKKDDTDLDNQINKNIYYASGLVEGLETIIFMLLCLLFPKFFVLISIVFSILCLATILGRIYISYKNFN